MQEGSGRELEGEDGAVTEKRWLDRCSTAGFKKECRWSLETRQGKQIFPSSPERKPC